MKVYLVTGGAGFIGSHLADALLASGQMVRVLDDFSTGHESNLDPRCEVVRADVCDVDAMQRAMAGVSGCFHLAAIASVVRSNEDWLGTHRVNLGGTINVLQAARGAAYVPVVYASSAAVYGRAEGVASEEMPVAPLTAYGADKRGCELHAFAGAQVHGLATLGFRFFNVYGPRQDPASPYSGVISVFANAIAMGRPIQIHGDGQQTRDFIFVGDIVRFLLAGMGALANDRNGSGLASGTVLNACTGRETSISALATAVAELAGGAPDVRYGPARPGDIQRSVGSPHLATKLLGVSAQTALRDGLKETLTQTRDRPLVLA